MNKYFEYLKPIRSDRQYRKVLKLMEKLFDSAPNSVEGQIAELLSILIEKYEEEKFPIDAPDPVDAIRFRMEQLGWTRKDLARVVGGKNRVSEILNHKRGLSLEMIRSLTKEMGVPAESLIGG